MVGLIEVLLPSWRWARAVALTSLTRAYWAVLRYVHHVLDVRSLHHLGAWGASNQQNSMMGRTGRSRLRERTEPGRNCLRLVRHTLTASLHELLVRHLSSLVGCYSLVNRNRTEVADGTAADLPNYWRDLLLTSLSWLLNWLRVRILIVRASTSLISVDLRIVLRLMWRCVLRKRRAAVLLRLSEEFRHQRRRHRHFFLIHLLLVSIGLVFGRDLAEGGALEGLDELGVRLVER